MTDGRFDFDSILAGSNAAREERVVRHVMGAVAQRRAPRADLASAILALGRPALAVAAVIVVLTRLSAAAPAIPPPGPASVGRALGLPPGAERVIRGARPASAEELLAALGEDR